MAEINRIHVSPGVYTSDMVDMKAAANSIGITKLAVVGETLKGPAFQPYWVHSPKEYAQVFGGTSPKKFSGSNYPKYELPYVANEFLKQGTELCVVKTLGFSGYNAGPAWVITGGKSTTGPYRYVVAVLRSRGGYKYRTTVGGVTTADGCPCGNAYDSMNFMVGEIDKVVSCNQPTKYNMSAVRLSDYYSLNYDGSDCTAYHLNDGSAVGFSASVGNLGRFTIECLVGAHAEGESPGLQNEEFTVRIPVSLNKSDKDYILNVLGSRNDDGDQPLYVETLYDVAWEDMVLNLGYDTIDSALTTYNVSYAADYGGLNPVDGILMKHEEELKKSDVGKRFLYSESYGSPVNLKAYVFGYNTQAPVSEIPENRKFSFDAAKATSSLTIHVGEKFELSGSGTYDGVYINNSLTDMKLADLMDSPTFGGTNVNAVVEKTDSYFTQNCIEGCIYTVAQIIDASGKRRYVYRCYDKADIASISNEMEKISAQDQIITPLGIDKHSSIVYNYEDGLYYKNNTSISASTIQSMSPTYRQTGTTFTISLNVEQLTANLFIEDAPNTVKVSYKKSVLSNIWINVDRNFDGTWSIKAQEGTTDAMVNVTGLSGRHNTKVLKNENGMTVYGSDVKQVLCDLNDYKSQFRYSSTPWIVSNVKGDAKHIELNKMFRFHTISDGANSRNEVKVSIENIRPDSGLFDVVVRSYNDSDYSTIVLERFSKCTMTPGKNYVAFKIGTIDGSYESKSKYITIEMAETSGAKNSVPAGFIGYPTVVYSGETIADDSSITQYHRVFGAPITYNLDYNEDIPKRKQYFGLSSISGFDDDYFTFKGNMATIESPICVTHGFHLDCRVGAISYSGTKPIITVDGEEGYVFDCVSVNARTSRLNGNPVIATEDEMEGCIYEDVKTRKFTVMFAGGFDGWDEYREQRSNTDEFAYSTYRGYIATRTGVGYGFNVMTDAASYGIEGNALTSDYYATLAGVSLLKNPEEIDINLLATPGIDTMNNTKLVEEVFDVLDERADTFYIVGSPDKEMGASDYADDIMDVDEFVSDFVDKEIHSDNAATYYPWIKIEDDGEYVWLPATRDVVRNLAESDNTNTTMNLAPAGTTRGKVDAIRARKNLKNGESDALYEANINPVRTYAQEGVVIMGQKTLRAEDDLMNRVDVRRMVLRMRKLIAVACLGLIFEPNDNTTVKAFKTIISGVMQTFMDNRAIEKWSMDVDDSQEARDRLELNATIYLKPIRALEYISLNFVVTNKDVYFED